MSPGPLTSLPGGDNIFQKKRFCSLMMYLPQARRYPDARKPFVPLAQQKFLCLCSPELPERSCRTR